MIKSLYILVIFSVSFTSISGQNWDRFDVPFRSDGKVLVNAGMNGMVAPQFSNYDFNGDGNEDLFVFDRQSGVVMTFVWDTSGEEGQMIFAPEYASMFPEMVNFAKLIDYDRDGDRDIFTFPRNQAASSIELLKNHGTDAQPDFRTVRFPDAPADALNYASNGGFAAIYVASTDVPAIVDVDGDGDFDVLSFEQLTGSFLGFYRNIQVEEGLPVDSMAFVFDNICWGAFSESGLNSNIELSDDPSDCAPTMFNDGKGGGGQRHSGSTIEVFDNDGDGDMDAFIGDLSSPFIVHLTNGGTLDNAWMTEVDTEFPSYTDDPINLNLFVSVSYVDVDNDGVRELLAAPNSTNSSSNINHVWLYENNGTDSAPVFDLKTKEFLFESSLRIPESSKPAFVDVDADGLLDMIVGSYGYNIGNILADTRLFYYRNIGTATSPSYRLEDEDYLDFSVFDQFDSLRPTFGDMDGDGDVDLVVGTDEGTLFYFENVGGEGQALQFGTSVFPYMDIDVGKKANPQIVDLDKDGLVDLVIGGRNEKMDPVSMNIGGVLFYKNFGTATEPSFNEEADIFGLGKINTRDITVTSGNSSPTIIPTQMGEDFIIIVGSKRGNLYMYDEVVDHLLDTFRLVTSSISVPRYGKETALALADIDNDNYYEMVIGNLNGGLAFHNTPLKVNMGNATDDVVLFQVEVYPNPSGDVMHVIADGLAPDRYEIFSIDGRTIVKNELTHEKISVQNLPDGFYLLKLSNGSQSIVKKIVVQK